MERRHQLALGGERDLARRAGSARRARRPPRPAFRAATSSAPSVGSPCTIQRPSCSAHDGVVRAIGRGRARARARRGARPRSRRRPRAAPRPPARSPMPVNVTRPLAVTTTRTVISFFVSVPVLSDAMTLAEPSVSTAARWRTIALRFAMRCTPSESTAVTIAGSPSGTAATASATPRMSTSSSCRQSANVLDEDDRRDHHDGDHDDDDAEQLARAIELALERRRSAGVVAAACRRCAPSRCCMPVAVTTAVAAAGGRRGAVEHHVRAIAERRVGRDGVGVLRHRKALAGERRLRRLQDAGSTTRASAGIVSPSSMSTTSPGTSSARGRARRSPSRTTVASSADIARSAATAASARDSCTKPIVALSSTTAKMAIASYGSDRIALVDTTRRSRRRSRRAAG